ncbi:uncharacterized protein J8A68_003547 [[Candida] subhashii]|uniref:Uncharacterized protein n=1 Tax=[Candida] subhashii TaxID=561895 RepID=A0A8J5QLS1_9ASCO|nr:uncharacterized protein J8A68_003547 [[Candida] subhashii]KAG7662921.1 hypothetical protein J8A68_003547 [[Candida] subhashii]
MSFHQRSPLDNLSPITYTKCKLLPTKSISRGQFRGFNDIRRFHCYNPFCNTNSSEFQLCEYCRHVPYVSSPLRYYSHSNTTIKTEFMIKTGSSVSSGSTVSSLSCTNTSNRGSFMQRKTPPISPIKTAITTANTTAISPLQPSTSPTKIMLTASNAKEDLSSKINEFLDHLEINISTATQ